MHRISRVGFSTAKKNQFLRRSFSGSLSSLRNSKRDDDNSTEEDVKKTNKKDGKVNGEFTDDNEEESFISKLSTKVVLNLFNQLSLVYMVIVD